MTATHIKDLLEVLGFTPKNGENNIYIKVFSQHANFSIEVDFNEQKINYGNKIKLWDNTTANFSHPENLVVLECVNRLLEKGYKPQNIELEKNYLLGRKNKGKVDVLVNNIDNTPFLMIECKTCGQEYEKEKSKMLKDGGQLFSYYTNDRAVKYLCLYASKVNKKAIQYTNSIIPTLDEWQALSGTKEIVAHWNKIFKDNGIFEPYTSAYNIMHKILTYDSLKDLKEEDSGIIYNGIMEILRHNAISDKPNAFNKLLNLFICKIKDELENSDNQNELGFQWREGDTDEDLQLRLNDLYKDGMHEFVNIEVEDFTKDEFYNTLRNSGENIDVSNVILNKIYTTLRLKKSANFAFKEIENEAFFRSNAKVVKEMVKLLQEYKFRYGQRHAFLGELFERILNDSMKQESGQFFTPVPIANFIISSLPVDRFVQDKLDNRESNPLPMIIDFAAGSGHFLTEYMSKAQDIIQNARTDKARPEDRTNFKLWSGLTKFLWAKDYVYGIDLDYRLVKTAKVSAFFNGDGEARIICADGLDSFTESDTYIGKLKQADKDEPKDNRQFDILISNPPYSVEAFKGTLNHGGKSFELYDSATYNSKEIECLFVERMKQLLKFGGRAGIILPSSILSNGGIHSKAREILFKYFKFKAIAEMGSNTFMKTGTNTVILFLERRANGDWQRINSQIDTFFKDYRDVTVDGMENAFSKYTREVYDVDFADYKAFIKGKVNDGIKESDLVRDYAKFESKDIQSKEQEKMLYFLLTYPQKIVLVKSGEKQVEKNFLGYEFSERRGHEGIKFYPNGTKLYDDNDKLNPQKANSYIYNSFLGKVDLDIDEDLSEHLSYARMSGLIDYSTNGWDKKVNLRKKILLDAFNKYENRSLSNVAEIIRGVTYDKMQQSTTPTNNIVLTADNITLSGEFELNKQIFINESVKFDDKKKLSKNDCFICFSSGSKEHVGKVAFIENDTSYFAGGFMGIVRALPNTVEPKYLYFVLNSSVIRNYVRQISSGSNINNLSSTLLDLKISLPPIDIQKKIVAEIEEVEKQGNEMQDKIADKKEKIANIFANIEQHITHKAPMSENYILLNDKTINPMTMPQETFTYIDIDAVGNGTGTINITKKIIGKKAPSRARRVALSGSTLVSTVRPNLRAFAFVENEMKNCVYSTGFAIMRSANKNNIIDKWIYYNFAYSLDLMKQMVSAMPKGQYPSINANDIRKFTLYCPPLEKQKQLVEEIEKHEKDISEAQDKLKALEQKKKDILKTYLE